MNALIDSIFSQRIYIFAIICYFLNSFTKLFSDSIVNNRFIQYWI